jgi:hypothetical protein
MSTKKALSFGIKSERGFLFKKKLTAFFIFVSLSVNGFAPSAAEVSKYSLVMMAAAIAQNTAVKIIDKCDMSIGDLASDIYMGLSDVLERTPISSKADEGKDEGEGRALPVGAEAIITKHRVQNEKVKEEKEKVYYFEAFKGAEFGKRNEESGAGAEVPFGVIVIMFLMFIAAIERRKCENCKDNVRKNIKGKEISV